MDQVFEEIYREGDQELNDLIQKQTEQHILDAKKSMSNFTTKSQILLSNRSQHGGFGSNESQIANIN